MHISVKQYASKLHKLTPDQLNNISNTDTLDNDQQDLIALHRKNNHVTFPEMTKLPEKGRINKRFDELKDRLTVRMS